MLNVPPTKALHVAAQLEKPRDLPIAQNPKTIHHRFCMTANPKLNDVAQYYHGADIVEPGSSVFGILSLPQVLAEEQSDRDNIATIFGW